MEPLLGTRGLRRLAAVLGLRPLMVFDFDGTISLIRAGWFHVMVPMMVEVLAELKTGETEEQLTELVSEFVYELTGKQTVYQTIELARQVELRSGKPVEVLSYSAAARLPVPPSAA